MIITETEKLYSPLNFHLRDKEDAQAGVYDDIHYWRDELSHQEAAGYLDEIELFLRRDQDRMGTDRGIMAYCRSDVLSGKVYSLTPSVELHGDKLWMVADVRLNEPLTPRDMADLKSWWGGQLSDGWGEGIGQREIKVDRGDLYIEPWTSSAGFFIATREEFAHRLGVEDLQRHGIQFPAAAEAEQAAPGDSARERPLTEQKLYSPVYCELMEKYHDDFDSEHEGSPIPQTGAAYYVDVIHEAILKERMPDEEPRGLMSYYHDADSVNDKVRSLLVDVEVHDDKLWGVATIRVTEPLTPQELDTLRDFISGQYSDGFGEGFEQREIKVGDGELSVHLWDYDREGGFFIDTEREFRQRLGLEAPEAESPARAALHEPDIYDDEATAALREQLIERIDANLLAYFDEIRGNEELSITGMSSEIAAVTGAHYYLSEIHIFHASELEYLLQFANPLAVVADKFQIAGMDDYSDVMWEIFDRQDALEGDYERMPGPDDIDARKQELFGRLDKNLTDFRTGMMDASKETVFDSAEEIAAHYAAREYLKTAYDFKTGEVEYLLQFQDPLAVVADKWLAATDHFMTVTDVVAGALEDKGSHGHYARIMDTDAPAAKESARSPGAAEKLSVLEQIRQAREAAPKEPRNDKPARDKSGPEL